NAATQRAYHLDELKNGVAGDNDKKIKIDINYYLEHQIHPVISRLCEPLEGLDRMKIAECLGLDPQKFKGGLIRSHRSDEANAGESFTKSNLQKFRLCEKFKFLCVQCKSENIVASGFRPSSHVSVLQDCSNSECSSQPFTQVGFIRNQLILQIKRFIRRFYENWLVCDDPSCNLNTRVYSHMLKLPQKLKWPTTFLRKLLISF
uniref:DNA-directed DNA polymerase n=1 Tax=Megaselia scalaris TaxID=36166 RepID=T1GVJ8_MEGSC